jgi:hypothetical protein
MIVQAGEVIHRQARGHVFEIAQLFIAQRSAQAGAPCISRALKVVKKEMNAQGRRLNMFGILTVRAVYTAAYGHQTKPALSHGKLILMS